MQLNSYDLTKATLDHATRIVKVLSTCTYLRIEAQTVSSKCFLCATYFRVTDEDRKLSSFYMIKNLNRILEHLNRETGLQTRKVLCVKFAALSP